MAHYALLTEQYKKGSSKNQNTQTFDQILCMFKLIKRFDFQRYESNGLAFGMSI